MRSLGVVVFALAGVAFGQGLTEYGAAAAGATVGSAAGKKVSDGINNIFGKVDAQTKEAAKGKAPAKQKPVADATPAPAAETAPATESPKSAPAPAAVRTASAKPRPAGGAKQTEDRSMVPPPPPAPVQRAVVAKVEPPPPAPVVQIAPPLPPPPPPPQVKTEDLQTLAVGTRRDVLLKLGAPASRVTMFDDGHLLEIYHYASRDATIGVVRLNDGVVASVHVN